MEMEYDFSGWATKNDVLCSDGRVIRKNAFQHNDGAKVPLMWGHQHNDPLRVLGHGILENREEGVYVYGKFNDSESGQAAKYAVEHGDVTALSIYANQLKQNGKDVMHGNIREVSLVVAGANPSAYIENVVRHSDDGEEDIVIHEEALIFTGEELILAHAENVETENIETETTNETETMTDEDISHAEAETDNDAEDSEEDIDIKAAVASMNPQQKKAFYLVVAQLLKEQEESKNQDESDNDKKDDKVEHSEGGNETMKTNVFDQAEVKNTSVLSHADQKAILAMASEPGVASLQKAIKMYTEQNKDTMAHAFADGADGVEALFPEHELITPGAPKVIRDADQNWVMGVINKIKKSPYARIRTRFADARISELKADYAAKGYNDRETAKKLTDAIKIIGRKTEPTTIYLKDELHRDDINDIQDFDVVNYIWNFMKDNYYETLALAALVGDSREDGDPDKINEENIRPIWKDDELYTIHADVDFEGTKTTLQGSNTGANFGENYIYAEAMITAALYAREKFKGTGTPDLYCAPHLVNVMLLARDLNGRRIYDSKADLARALNVNSIVEIEQLEGRTRTDKEGKEKKLIGLFVNLADYQFGSAKGGELTKFSDFDIDYNKYKYLMEGRCSGSLTALSSAIALEEDVTEEEAAG